MQPAPAQNAQATAAGCDAGRWPRPGRQRPHPVAQTSGTPHSIGHSDPPSYDECAPPLAPLLLLPQGTQSLPFPSLGVCPSPPQLGRVCPPTPGPGVTVIAQPLVGWAHRTRTHPRCLAPPSTHRAAGPALFSPRPFPWLSHPYSPSPHPPTPWPPKPSVILGALTVLPCQASASASPDLRTPGQECHSHVSPSSPSSPAAAA